MNRENLQKMADFIRTVPQEQFDMRIYSEKKECGTIGCVIGNYANNMGAQDLMTENQGFYEWSLRFSGLTDLSLEWNWCFDVRWHTTDNTPTGAALRIEWLLNHGLPENWGEQMDGDAPLCYLPPAQPRAEHLGACDNPTCPQFGPHIDIDPLTTRL